MRYEILPNGNLKIIADEADRQALRELQDEKGQDFTSDQTMSEALDHLIANSELNWSDPVAIQALTSAPILAIHGQTRPATPQDVNEAGEYVGCQFVGRWDNAAKVDPIVKAWGFMNYAVTSPQEELLEKGECVWQLGWDAETVKTASFNLEAALQRRRRGSPSSVGKIEPAIVGKNWKKHKKLDTRLLPVHRYTEAQADDKIEPFPVGYQPKDDEIDYKPYTVDYKPGDLVDVNALLMSGGAGNSPNTYHWLRGYKFVRREKPGVPFTATGIHGIQPQQDHIIVKGPVVGGEGEVRYDENAVRPAQLRAVKVWFSDGDHLVSNMAKGITDEEIRDYYAIGRTFNVGLGPKDNLVQVTRIQILE